MRKELAVILSASVTALLLSSCTDGTNHSSTGNDIDDWTHPTTASAMVQRDPTHDLSRVDARETFSDFVYPDYCEPWGAEQNLKMTRGDVKSYFIYYELNANDEQVNTNLNYISTITRPGVMVYPADEKGYVIYEVTYSQTFPIISTSDGSYVYSFFTYHGVSFVDYYTGTVFPCVNLSTQIDSYEVKGNYIMDGDTKHIACYEFREQELLDSGAATDSNGNYVSQETIQLTSTAYFIVPEDYDGLLMGVYVADDTGKSLSEVLEDDSPYLIEPYYFNDTDNPDDYVFFGINAPK
ncbi:MAG: hypothetical protein IKD91_07840 [Clostridiales bacterium]|nr:hypothetical protein [Clostridiales bacterium]